MRGRNGYPPGQQRAFVMARCWNEHPVIIVGAEHPEVIRQAHLRAAPTMEAASAEAIAGCGPRPAGAPPLEALIVAPRPAHAAGGARLARAYFSVWI